MPPLFPPTACAADDATGGRSRPCRDVPGRGRRAPGAIGAAFIHLRPAGRVNAKEPNGRFGERCSTLNGHTKRPGKSTGGDMVHR